MEPGKKPSIFRDMAAFASDAELEKYGAWVKSDGNADAGENDAELLSDDALLADVSDIMPGADEQPDADIDFSVDIPAEEEAQPLPPVNTPAREGVGESPELLQKIAGELDSIKTELSDLRAQVSDLKTQETVPPETEASQAALDDYMADTHFDDIEIPEDIYESSVPPPIVEEPLPLAQDDAEAEAVPQFDVPADAPLPFSDTPPEIVPVEETPIAAVDDEMEEALPALVDAVPPGEEGDADVEEFPGITLVDDEAEAAKTNEDGNETPHEGAEEELVIAHKDEEPEEEAPLADSAALVQTEPVEVKDEKSGVAVAPVELPADFKKELSELLMYMDGLLDSLPEDKIEEFARSDNFVRYKNVFKALGLLPE